MEHIYLWLGVVAALLHGTAYVVYNWQVLTGKSEPKSASWGVWAFLAALNAFSFKEMLEKFSEQTEQSAVLVAWVTALQFFVGTVGAIGTFALAWRHGKLKRPSGNEWNYLVAGLVASVVWKIFDNAAAANLIILVAVMISFKPTLAAVMRSPFVDSPKAWQIWTAAFSVTSLNLALQRKVAIAFIMPVAMLLAHGTVAWLCRESRRRVFYPNPRHKEMTR